MNTQVNVREAAPGDAEAMARLCVQLGYPAESREMPARLARLSDDPHARAFVATHDGVVVGLLTVHLRNTLNHEAPIGQITLLVVDEANRSRGAGRALVEAAEAWARSRGTKRITVTTALDRGVAHAFYEKVGYLHTGRRYAKNFSAPDTHTR
jgi:GNAT superfamily N-acetyltransferase